MIKPPSQSMKNVEILLDNVGKQPMHLRVDKSKWDKYDMTLEENKSKRYKGLVVAVSGFSKVGKTYTAMSAEEYLGYIGKIYELGPGLPMYYIDTENTAYAEYKRHHDGKLIKILNIENINPSTLEEDPLASFEEIKEMAYSASDNGRGVVVIDSLTDHCDWASEVMIEKKKDEGNFSPYDHGKLKKEIKTFLRKMKAKEMIVLYTFQIKKEYEKTGVGVWDFTETGGYLLEATKGVEHWCDVLVRLEKMLSGDNIVRQAYITGSRFEDSTINIKEISTSNKFVDIMKKIEPYL